MASIIHFDISVDDIQRAKRFYEQLFDWKITKYPLDGPEYYLIETKTDAGTKGISGGLAQRSDASQKITNFIQVASIDESIAKVLDLGGQILEEKTLIPSVGYIVGCKDTEDNTFGLIELEQK